MTEAQRQIEQAAAHAKRKGLIITGHHPERGLPKHPDGSLRMIVQMDKPGRATAEAAPPKPAAATVSRGVAPAQGSLI